MAPGGARGGAARLLLLPVGALLGGALAAAHYELELRRLEQELRLSQAAARPQAAQPTLAEPHEGLFASPFGLPRAAQQDKRLSRYALGYDRRLRSSTWAYEILTRASVAGDASRRGARFREDTSEPEMFRARVGDYADSGLDRGHLVPAGDVKDAQAAMEETFLLSNIVPQDSSLNRGFWSKTLERFVRELASRFDEVHTITGPLFVPEWDAQRREWRANHRFLARQPRARDVVLTSGLPASEALAAAESVPAVPVPTHLYKVVLAVSRSAGRESRYVAAFVVPNQPVDAAAPLSQFQVPLDALEALSGHEFFPQLAPQQRGGDLCAEVGCDAARLRKLLAAA
jgi:DNA/RNA endonuclease G (NUC1)